MDLYASLVYMNYIWEYCELVQLPIVEQFLWRRKQGKLLSAIAGNKYDLNCRKEDRKF